MNAFNAGKIAVKANGLPLKKSKARCHFFKMVNALQCGLPLKAMLSITKHFILNFIAFAFENHSFGSFLGRRPQFAVSVEKEEEIVSGRVVDLPEHLLKVIM